MLFWNIGNGLQAGLDRGFYFKGRQAEEVESER